MNLIRNRIENKLEKYFNIMAFIRTVGVVVFVFTMCSCESQLFETEPVNDILNETSPSFAELNYQPEDTVPTMVMPLITMGFSVAEDYEIYHLNEMLMPYGITAFRIDPENSDHIRRYGRHLNEPDNFYSYYEVEEDI